MSDGTPLPNRSEETPVSGRDYPEEDPEGRRWSEIWRVAVEELNANALVSDLGANRLDYSPEDGTLYIPTDGGDWYLGDGSGWNNLGPVGDITSHTNDTTNPHSVTSDQVGSPSDAEFSSHTSDTTNPHSVTASQADALPTSGGTMTGDVTFGEGSVETISETGATLSFTGTDTRDIHDVTDVSLSNSSGASVTEDATLDYHQGVDNTGTLLESQTQSVTLADGASTTVQFLTADFALDNVDYFIEVTTTNLTVDGIDEVTMGASYVTEQTSTGDLVTTDQNGRERARYDATSGTVSYPAVDTDGLNTSQSFRDGRTVYYNPTNPGPFADGQDALANTPTGGTFIIAEGVYDVATEGPLHVSRPINIRGEGIGRDENNDWHGTVLESTYDAGPTIEVAGPSGQRIEGATIRDLGIRQTAETSHPMVRIADCTDGDISDCFLAATGNADTCLRLDGQSFLFRAERNKMVGWRVYGIEDVGSGFGNSFTDNTVSSGNQTGGKAFYSTRARPVIIGGTYTSRSVDGCAIHLDGNADGTYQSGGVIIEPGIEDTEYPLRIGGTGPRHSVQAYNVFLGHIGTTVVTGIDLISAKYCKIRPEYDHSSTGRLADYHDGSSTNNVIEVSSQLLRGMTVAGTPGADELIRVFGGARDFHLTDYPSIADIKIAVDYTSGPDHWGPAFAVGSNWHTVDSTQFTP